MKTNTVSMNERLVIDLGFTRTHMILTDEGLRALRQLEKAGDVIFCDHKYSDKPYSDYGYISMLKPQPLATSTLSFFNPARQMFVNSFKTEPLDDDAEPVAAE